MADIRGLLGAGVGLGPNAGVDLASKHLSADLRLYDIAGQAGLPTSERLSLLLERRPKLLIDLLSTANSDVHSMERVLRVPHKPSTQAANKVSLHQEPLSDFAIQYILDHGGKTAHTNLLERQAGRLPIACLIHLQDTLFHQYKALVFVAPEGTHMRGATLIRGWRKMIRNSVQLLSQVTDAHRRPKGFENMRQDILMCAVAIGEPIPAGCLQDGESVPTVEDMLESLDTDEALLDVRGRRNTSANSLIGHHREALKLYAELPHLKQVMIYGAAPCWQLLDRAQDPARMWADNNGWPRLRDSTGGYAPSYRSARAIPVNSLMYISGSAVVPTIYRLLENTLGDDHYAWVTFESLYEGWTGTLGELVDTVKSMH